MNIRHGHPVKKILNNSILFEPSLLIIKPGVQTFHLQIELDFKRKIGSETLRIFHALTFIYLFRVYYWYINYDYDAVSPDCQTEADLIFYLLKKSQKFSLKCNCI